MKEILLEHFRKYPKMEIADAVKLLYQSEFGGGHMIPDPSRSLKRIRQEWRERWKDDAAGGGTEKRGQAEECQASPDDGRSGREAVCESIGCGMYRIYLDALDNGLAAETLNEIFVQTADRKVGSMEAFERKLETLAECCKEGSLPFDEAEVRMYLKKYQQQGYPAVSHSRAYRESYHPSYRVAADYFVRYYEVFRQIDLALKAKKQGQVLVAIDGMCASGKSTMGRILQGIYGCNLFHMDDFFLQPHQRTRMRLEEAGGNVDYERFQEEVLGHIKDQDGFTYQVYNCQKQRLDQKITVPWKRLNLVEGSYSQHPYFGDVWDLRIFCQVSEEEQLKRIRVRNGEVMSQRFQQEWIPKENAYFSAFHIREQSIPAENFL